MQAKHVRKILLRYVRKLPLALRENLVVRPQLLRVPRPFVKKHLFLRGLEAQQLIGLAVDLLLRELTRHSALQFQLDLLVQILSVHDLIQHIVQRLLMPRPVRRRAELADEALLHPVPVLLLVQTFVQQIGHHDFVKLFVGGIV